MTILFSYVTILFYQTMFLTYIVGKLATSWLQFFIQIILQLSITTIIKTIILLLIIHRCGHAASTIPVHHLVGTFTPIHRAGGTYFSYVAHCQLKL